MRWARTSFDTVPSPSTSTTMKTASASCLMVLSIDTMHTGAGIRNGDLSIIIGLAESDRPRAAHDKPKSAIKKVSSSLSFLDWNKGTIGDQSLGDQPCDS